MLRKHHLQEVEQSPYRVLQGDVGSRSWLDSPHILVHLIQVSESIVKGFCFTGVQGYFERITDADVSLRGKISVSFGGKELIVLALLFVNQLSFNAAARLFNVVD